MKTALIFPPQWYPSQPYLALPTLKAYLQAHGHTATQFDFNVESYDRFLTRPYLEQCLATIRRRLDAPAYSIEERDIKTVYRQILADGDYLESVLAEVESAKAALRTAELFFQFPVYKRAYTTLKVAMKLISYAHHPSRIDLESFFMDGAPEENLQGILTATADRERNPYLALFEESVPHRADWNAYGLVGISIIHVGQVIPGLTLARLFRERYPHLHVVIGGSVFTRHADILHSKQILFEKFFHSIVLFEGEHPLERLAHQLKSAGDLAAVPNLVHLTAGGRVVRNAAAKSLPYEELVPPDFDDLDLKQYLMPYPVLPYMSSRGCYWGKCTFCTHSHIYDSYYRKENEHRAARELANLSRRYNTRYFTFSDEAISPNAFRRMSGAILDAKLDMRALGMIKFESDSIESPDLFEHMYKAGFIMLFFGLESANDRILSIIDKGCDRETEKQVLTHSSQAGIWNHLYLFFGFPTEERHEAEDTIDFVVRYGETRDGHIQSVGQSIFSLEKDSAIYHNPEKFKIERIHHAPDRDMAVVFDYEIRHGMPREEVMDVYENFEQVINEHFPSARIWKYLSREHFLLYLDRYGKDGIRKLAQEETLLA
jgi:radical SAM superfamily enzyme YgiQ (UPF0313 family)